MIVPSAERRPTNRAVPLAAHVPAGGGGTSLAVAEIRVDVQATEHDAHEIYRRFVGRRDTQGRMQ
jgi:hypothetical protein